MSCPFLLAFDANLLGQWILNSRATPRVPTIKLTRSIRSRKRWCLLVNLLFLSDYAALGELLSKRLDLSYITIWQRLTDGVITALGGGAHPS
jgi:hypothetical protein